jgi:hypothetical protein
LLQVWTRFALFGEIHSFSFLKILKKFREPLDASRDHPSKFQLKKKFPRASNISSSSLRALFYRFQKSSEGSVSFSSELVVDLASARVSALLPVPPSYPVHRTVAWPVASVGGDLSRQLRRLPQWQNLLWRLAEASVAERRPPHRPSHWWPTRVHLLL